MEPGAVSAAGSMKSPGEGGIINPSGAFTPGAEEGEEVGGVRVAVAVHIAGGRPPRPEQVKQVGGIHIAVAMTGTSSISRRNHLLRSPRHDEAIVTAASTGRGEC